MNPTGAMHGNLLNTDFHGYDRSTRIGIREKPSHPFDPCSVGCLEYVAPERKGTASHALIRRSTIVALTRHQVKHIAELAKLSLTDPEIDLFGEQLSTILEFAARLDELDTDAIPPTATVLPLRNVMRPDEVRPSPPRDVMLQNAPTVAEGCIKVHPVLEGLDS